MITAFISHDFLSVLFLEQRQQTIVCVESEQTSYLFFSIFKVQTSYSSDLIIL
jgi:hypothetical protein